MIHRYYLVFLIVFGAIKSFLCTPTGQPTGQPTRDTSPLCGLGKFSPDGKTNCEPCAPGYYGAYRGMIVCQACPAGKFVTLSGSKSVSACNDCPPGTRSLTGYSACTACALGKYSSNFGMNDCSFCTKGRYASATGSSACTSCVPGKSGDKVGSASSSDCVDCTSGKFSIDGTRCISCPGGFAAAATGQISSAACQACNPGYYALSGSSSCTACPAMTYSNQKNSSACTNCGQNAFSIPGSTSCTKVSFSFPFQANDVVPFIVPDNMTSLKVYAFGAPGGCYYESCSKGGYISAIVPVTPGQLLYVYRGNAPDVRTSPEDLYSRLVVAGAAGSPSWDYVGGDGGGLVGGGGNLGGRQDGPGTAGIPGAFGYGASYYDRRGGDGWYGGSASPNWWDRTGGGSSYSSGSILVNMQGANAGSAVLYITPINTTSACLAGNYPVNGACSPCSAGFYAPAGGMLSCFACKAGKYSISSSAITSSVCIDCVPGKRSLPGYSACTSCVAGKFEMNSGSPECSYCPGGQWSGTVGATSCNQCIAGKASAAIGATLVSSCTDCSPGTYSRQGSTACINCAAGKYSAVVAATSDGACLNCPPGKYSPAGATACTDCTSNTYSNVEGTGLCTACAANYMSLPGSVGCSRRTIGFTYSTTAVSQFVGPTSVLSLLVDAFGAPGGCYYESCSKGGYISAIVPVTPGQLLYVYRGNAPDVRTSPEDLYSRLVVAGAAGSPSWDYVGGDGGGLVGGGGNLGGRQDGPGTAGIPGAFGYGASYYDRRGGDGWYGGSSGDSTGGGSSYSSGNILVNMQGANAGPATIFVSVAKCARGQLCCTEMFYQIYTDDCLPCPLGSHSPSLSTDCICDAGWTRTSAKAECTACPAGSHKSEVGNGPCVFCEPGSYSISGSQYCTLCAAGRYSPSRASSACRIVPAGWYPSVPLLVSSVPKPYRSIAASSNFRNLVVASDVGSNPTNTSTLVDISSMHARVFGPGSQYTLKALTDNYFVFGNAAARKVYIFGRDANGEWISADPVATFDTYTNSVFFGFNAKISPDERACVVTAHGSRKAFIFANIAGNWNTASVVVIDGYTSYSDFAHSLALSNNYIMLGSYTSRMVWVFARDSSLVGWSATASQTYSYGAVSSFGLGIAIAPNEKYACVCGDEMARQCYIFKQTNNAWNSVADSSFSSSESGFGVKPTMSDNTLVIATGGVGVANARKLFMYTFNSTSSLWSVDAVVSDYTRYEGFGFSLAVSENHVMVTSANFIFIFSKTSAGSWNTTASLRYPTLSNTTVFGGLANTETEEFAVWNESFVRTASPSLAPSFLPTIAPTTTSTLLPTISPTESPTFHFGSPTGQPSSQPSALPSGQPSSQPSAQPTGQPSSQPSALPSGQPSSQPSAQPTGQPSSQPSALPSGQPSSQPSTQPSMQPSMQPTAKPFKQSGLPTLALQPTEPPTFVPSLHPSHWPSSQPTAKPSSQPTQNPTSRPSSKPSGHPSAVPSASPTFALGAFVAFFRIKNPGFGYLFLSATSGTSWTKLEAAGKRRWQGVSGDNLMRRIVASEVDGYLYRSNDGGNSWIALQNAGKRNWRSVRISADASKILAVNYGGFIHYSLNNGTSWGTFASAGTRQWYGITSNAMMTRIVATVNDGPILYSDNSGISWNPFAGAGVQAWRDVSSSATFTTFVVVSATSGLIYKSIDAGQTWMPLSNVKMGTNRFSVTCDSTCGLLASTSSYRRIEYSEDAGLSWKNEGYILASVAVSSGATAAVSYCTAGKFSQAENSGCSLCPTGTWSNNDYASACQPCSPGKFGALTGSIVNSCTTCSAGSFSLSAASACTPCPSGRYIGNQGASACEVVLAGMVPNANVGATSVSNCPTGSTSVAGTASCVSCPAGKYATYSGAYDCISCDPGKYSSVVGSSSPSSCQTCGIGKFSVGGQASCTPCPAGTFSNSQGISACPTVPAGYIPYVPLDLTSSDRNWRAMGGNTDLSKLIAVGSNKYPLRSVDGGITWKALVSAGTADWQGVACTSAMDKILLLPWNGYILVSTNSGDSWETFTSGGSRLWRSISVSDDLRLMVASVHGDYLYYSDNTGNSWTPLVSAGKKSWYGLSASRDMKNIAASVTNGGVFVSSDSGQTWRSINAIRNWRHIVANMGFNTVLGAFSSSGFVAKSSDMNTFSDLSSVGAGEWCGITANQDLTKIFVASSSGSMRDSSNGGIAWKDSVGTIVGWPTSSGATQILNCTAGSYSLAGASACTLCLAGFYGLTESAKTASSCLPCAAGKASGVVGANNAAFCQTCRAGYYASAGSSTCTMCAAGKYSNKIGATGPTACFLCQNGEVSFGAATACISNPTGQPTSQPSAQPSSEPTSQPSQQPSAKPTVRPSGRPSAMPTSQPTNKPSGQPTARPSGVPTSQPTSSPSTPTGRPTSRPSGQPTGRPTNHPTSQPSSQPTARPTAQPTLVPTAQPSGQPTSEPTTPTGAPTGRPSAVPTNQPSSSPSGQPTSLPSALPSGQPTSQPSAPTPYPTPQPFPASGYAGSVLGSALIVGCIWYMWNERKKRLMRVSEALQKMDVNSPDFPSQYKTRGFKHSQVAPAPLSESKNEDIAKAFEALLPRPHNNDVGVLYQQFVKHVESKPVKLDLPTLAAGGIEQGTLGLPSSTTPEISNVLATSSTAHAGSAVAAAAKYHQQTSTLTKNDLYKGDERALDSGNALVTAEIDTESANTIKEDSPLIVATSDAAVIKTELTPRPTAMPLIQSNVSVTTSAAQPQTDLMKRYQRNRAAKPNVNKPVEMVKRASAKNVNSPVKKTTVAADSGKKDVGIKDSRVGNMPKR